MALLDLYIFVADGVGFVYMCGVTSDWVRLYFWVNVLAFAFVCLLSILVCFVLFHILCILWLVVAPWPL